MLEYASIRFRFVCATPTTVPRIIVAAAITWLAELFPDKRQRELVLGGTQAFASVGGLLVTTANIIAVKYAASFPALPLPEAFNAHASWRYTLMTGLIPAIPIALMLPFVALSGARRLTEQDTILLADFTNTTGEPVFDGTLKVALAVALEQSPFIKVFSDDRVRDALRLMNHPTDERITRPRGPGDRPA